MAEFNSAHKKDFKKELMSLLKCCNKLDHTADIDYQLLDRDLRTLRNFFRLFSKKYDGVKLELELDRDYELNPRVLLDETNFLVLIDAFLKFRSTLLKVEVTSANNRWLFDLKDFREAFRNTSPVFGEIILHYVNYRNEKDTLTLCHNHKYTRTELIYKGAPLHENSVRFHMCEYYALSGKIDEKIKVLDRMDEFVMPAISKPAVFHGFSASAGRGRDF